MRDESLLRKEVAYLKSELLASETENSLKKIYLNGSFGKFGSKYSFLFSPQLLLQTTLTGQLSLLMLIERLHLSGKAQVVSANTDGIVVKYRKDGEGTVRGIVAKWELDTGFTTERASYRSLCSASVNNYIAIKTDGKIKSKGAYTPVSLNKNPANEICVDAVIAYLKEGTPLDHTIHTCRDFTKFVSVRKVTGGATHNNVYLGKTVRFYHKKDNKTAIYYKVNNHLVPKTEGAWPCMELPDVFPDDIDYDYYIKEAETILTDIGERLW